jgi:NAD(P)-dependent dehydrogenase (short-subunit alcohol dehydrogenase family)
MNVIVQAAFGKAETLLPGGLDYLICNAGVVGYEVPPSTESGAMVAETFKVNVFGALDVIQAALPLLHKGSKKTV